ncbi:TorF family putative porin [Ferrimonas gelatinilytica]|uniref:TorF family putative porin n=2 Tax=Ferrimonas gelatinilytica TaxID=1255257 RepID=A0ABP9SCR4_9GAMM
MKNAITRTLGSLFLLASLSAAPAYAEGTANVGVASDYLWRGVSQTDGKPSIFGGLDYASDVGIYVGTWVSNIDFGDDATYEWDLYAGYSGEAGDFSYDVGYVYYAYPNGDSLDFGEVYAGFGWNWFGFSLAYTTNEEADETYFDKGLYIEGTAEWGITDSLSLGFAVGNYFFDSDSLLEDYLNYNISLNKSTEMGDFAFMISDTDESDVDPVVLVSWTLGFDL